MDGEPKIEALEKSKYEVYLGWLKNRKKILSYTLLALFLIVSAYRYFLPPQDFPVGQVITIEPGQSLQSITNLLYESKIIKSTFIFRSTVIILGGEKKMKAGDYLLDSRSGPLDLAYRFLNGKYHLTVAKITIPEGWNVYEIGDYLEENLVNFDKAEFIKLSSAKEGYLFPDTYFVSPAVKPQKVVDLMQKNFESKKELMLGLATTTKSLKDIIIMASILEGEARTTESRRTIAGILWRRLALKMPLQVDATFSYINGKNTYELTLDDLQIDSPYNTYKYRGLPPGPIGNPGLDSILSAINPISTKYLYFLSSKSGDMYYATTFEQHKKNKELYLNK